MRDAVGGTFMMYIFIIFLVVFITFVAVAFNYARAFRVKNAVMDIIEQNEGIDDYTNTIGVMGEINNYLSNVSYRVNGINSSTPACDTYDYVNESSGYCITRVSTSSGIGGTASYYKVVTFVRLELPFLNLGFTIPIKGETRKIEELP